MNRHLVSAIFCSVVFLMTLAVQGQEEMPRVLILGDSNYQQPSNEITKALKGKAKVVFPRLEQGQVLNSTYLLQNLDEILGDTEWDLIHFNVGLGDLIYCLPDSRSFRVLPPLAGGVRATSAESYRKNLEELVPLLKNKCQHLIWANTTPIRHSATGVFLKGSEVEYNRIAALVMEKNGVPINDMHAFVSSVIDMNKPAAHGADPFSFDRKPIHGPVLKRITQKLEISTDVQLPANQRQ